MTFAEWLGLLKGTVGLEVHLMLPEMQKEQLKGTHRGKRYVVRVGKNP